MWSRLFRFYAFLCGVSGKANRCRVKGRQRCDQELNMESEKCARLHGTSAKTKRTYIILICCLPVMLNVASAAVSTLFIMTM